MPRAAPRICICGLKVPHGILCRCQKQRKAEADARRPTAGARGYGSKWRTARAEFLRLHPTCAMCSAPATVVDHIIPHRGDLSLFWRRSNWQPLCATHHSSTKQRHERAQGRG
jgi:5-methylcytosine-specific restriction protein A